MCLISHYSNVTYTYLVSEEPQLNLSDSLELCSLRNVYKLRVKCIFMFHSKKSIDFCPREKKYSSAGKKIKRKSAHRQSNSEPVGSLGDNFSKAYRKQRYNVRGRTLYLKARFDPVSKTDDPTIQL